MTKLKVLSLFAGIGGFDLGLERTGGFETVAFCEFDKKAQRVLARHWPEVPIYDDVRTLSGERLAADGIAVDVICGGFPCQDISTAGAGAGIEGERSGLWADYARLIGELRPIFVIVENVSALLSRGLDRVLGDLAAIGYDADWHCIPASAVGAPHRRDRIWIVAYRAGDRWLQGEQNTRRIAAGNEAGQKYRPSNDCEALADTSGDLRRPQPRGLGGSSSKGRQEAESRSLQKGLRHSSDGGLAAGGWWAVEPAVGRVADGVPGRVDRLKQLGNAVVPQVVELIGRAILASLEQDRMAA